MSTSKYDVIIVGGGPAGATAALYADRQGLNAVVVDKAVFPRDKICGDAISGKTVGIMRDLGLTNGLDLLEGSEINRITFGSPNHSQFNVHLKDSKNIRHITKGYVITREIFDNYLFKKAADVVETRQGFRVNNIIYEDESIVGISGQNTDGNIETLHAPLVMGCDGANSIIARKLGLYEMDINNTAVAIRCYYEGVEGLTDQIELHYVSEVKPGYFWIFPAGEGKANIGIGIFKSYAKKEKRSLGQIMDEIITSRFFRNRFKNARPLERPKGWNLPMGSIRRKNHGDGFLLLGDAAGLVDPFTGEGIGNAMVAAKHAMKVASKAKEMNNYESKTLREYDRLVWDELGGELATSTKLQKLARSSFLLNFVIKRAARNSDVQEIISGMLSNEVARDELSDPSFYFKILFS